MIDSIENDIEELVATEDENGEMTDLSKALVHNLLESDYLIRMG